MSAPSSEITVLLDKFSGAVQWDAHHRDEDSKRYLAEVRAELEARIAEAERDTARIEWIRAHATSVSDGYGPDGETMDLLYSTHGRVLLLEMRLPTVPRETADWTRAAIDRAIAIT